MSSHPFISRLQKSPKKRCTPRRKVGTALGGSRSPFHLSCPLVELLEPRRLLAAGDIDTSFGTAGVVKTSIGSGTSEVTAMALQPDGKTVAVGLAQGQGYAIARYNTDGSLDTSFGTGGTEIITSAGSAWQVAMQPDSKILLAGNTNDGSGNALVVRLTAEGAFDTTFGTNGETKVHVGDGTALALDSSGNILVAGDVGGNFDVARLSPDGTLNTTFGNDGIASFVAQPDANGTVAGLVVQKDGKIVVGGTGGATATTPGFAVVRFNSDGTPDTSFGSGGIAQTIVRGDDSATAATIQSDGKIVVAGSSRDALNGVSYHLAMTRFNADGSLDTTFGSGGQVLDQFGSNVSMIFDLLVEPTGKIVASGQADGYAALFRFNSDGSLDQTFGTGGVALSLQNTTGVDVGEGHAVVEQADGKYVMASDQFTLERFAGEAPPTTTGIGNVLVPENCPEIVFSILGDFQGGSVPATQLTYTLIADSNPALFTSATVDSQAGSVSLAYATDKVGIAQLTVRATDPDGAYVETSFTVAVGSNLPGLLDSTFGNRGVVGTSFGGQYPMVTQVAQQADGKLVAVGLAPSVGFAAARYNTDGSLDTSFGNSGTVTIDSTHTAFHVALQADGKILLSGDLNTFPDKTVVVRLNGNGSLDSNFGVDGRVTLDIGAGYGGLAVDSQGRIDVASDNFGVINVARLDADGSLDASFGQSGIASAPTAMASNVFDLILQSDGKIVVGGTRAGNGNSDGFVAARFNGDGTPDSSFGNGGISQLALDGSAEGMALAVQSDGKIVEGGEYIPPSGGTSEDVMVRFTGNGALDATFGSGGELLDSRGNLVWDLFTEPGGTIVAAVQVARVASLFRFLADGTPDNTFGIGGIAPSSPNAAGYSMEQGRTVVEQSDGKYVMAGDGFLLERFIGESPPTTSGISDVSVSENSPSTVVSLPGDFQGGSVAASELSYSVTAISNRDPLSSTSVDSQSGDLTLAFARNRSGTAQLTVRATDPDGAYVDATFSVTVNAVADASLTAMGATIDATEGAATSPSVATFTDADPTGVASDFTAAIDWGDKSAPTTIGSSQISEAGGTFSVPGSHVYTEEGTYTLTVTITDAGGATATVSPVATVHDAALSATAAAVSATAGGTFAGAVVTFTDADPAGTAADYTATIDWGDHSALTVIIGSQITESNETFSVAGNHVYATDGVYTITVTITDAGGATATVSTPASVQGVTATASGGIDTSYGVSGVAQAVFGANDATARVSALQPDGKLVVAGGLEVPQTHQSLGFAVTRFNSDGSLDTSFGNAGTAVIAFGGTVQYLAIQSDGKILISGDVGGDPNKNALVRLTDTGAIDTTFGTNGQVSLGGIGNDFALLPDGKIISVQGDTGKYQITRFNSDGSLDTTFGQGGTATSQPSTIIGPNDLAIDGSGDIVICGEYDTNQVPHVTVVRFKPDGSVDTSFGNDGATSTTLRGVVDDLNCLAIQPDGKILAGGLSVHPVTHVGWDMVLMRYNADGSLDSTFGTGGIVIDSMPEPFDTAINHMFVEPDGKIVAAGRLGENAALFRFDPDGSLDTSFGNGGVVAASGFEHDGYGAVEQANGEYILAGSQGTPLHFATERFFGEIPPTSSDISDVTVTENSAPTVISLPSDFRGGSVPSTQLTYSVEADSNRALFSSVTIDYQTCKLTLAYAAGETGAAQLAVRATDPDGAYVDATFQVTVNSPSHAALTATGATITAVEGASFTGTVATFTDADTMGNVSQFNATINWGDGSSSTGTITANGGVFTVLGSHTYAEEGQSLPLSVTINDVGGAQTTASGTAKVSDAPLHLTPASITLPSSGAADNLLVATFSDHGGPEPLANYAATIDWGDGTTTAGSLSLSNGVFQIAGSHQYTGSGTFTIGVSVKDDGGSSDALTEQTTLNPTPHQKYVTAVYEDVLGRAPDATGLMWWTLQLDNGAPTRSVAEQIAHSAEYYAKFVIQPAYLKLLGRPADAAGIDYWTSQMDAGVTDQELEAYLVSSQEFYQNSGGTNLAWIDAVYKLLLGRPADSGGESYWTTQLAAGEALGQAAQGIAGSQENNTQLINDDYFHYLGRPADAGGLSFWLAEFAAGKTNEDVIAGFTGSAEYYKEHTSSS